MKQFIYNNEKNRVEKVNVPTFESHKIPVTKDINKTVTPNTISHDNEPTFYSESYLQAVKIVNNVLSMLYRRSGAYAYKRMLTDLYVDRLFIENTETKTQALVDYKARREEIKATLTDTHLEPDIIKALKIERDIISGYIHDIEHDTHNTSKSYDLVMTAYTVLRYFEREFIDIDEIIPTSHLSDFAIEYIYNTTCQHSELTGEYDLLDDDYNDLKKSIAKTEQFCQKEYTPYKLAYKMVNRDINSHGKMQQAIKTADKIGVDGLTAKARKEFYNEENNPTRHNIDIECWYSVLTIKEREIIPYLMQGNSYREIARKLGLNEASIRKRIKSIRSKIKQVTEETTTEE